MPAPRAFALPCLALIALLAGCGSDSDDKTSSTLMATPASASTSVEISDFLFAPVTARVTVGGKVTFTNADPAPHTATAVDKSFDTGVLRKGQSKTVTVTKAGTFKYICDLHPYMKATLVVE